MIFDKADNEALGEVIYMPAAGDSGITDITTPDSDAPAIYYNLQGVRVDAPSRGLYIVTRGSHTTKELR